MAHGSAPGEFVLRSCQSVLKLKIRVRSGSHPFVEGPECTGRMENGVIAVTGIPFGVVCNGPVYWQAGQFQLDLFPEGKGNIGMLQAPGGFKRELVIFPVILVIGVRIGSVVDPQEFKQ